MGNEEMNGKQIKKVAVIGAGMMGSCIGLEFARFGYEVVLYDLFEEQLEKSLRDVREELDLMEEAELISCDAAKAALGRLRTTTQIAEAASDADHIVEAVPEDLNLKQGIFARLDELCREHVSIATNTSLLKVDDCAAKARRFPSRILGTHYWQPAHLIPLVEVIGGKRTDPEVIRSVAALLRTMRKRVVIQEHELPTSPAGWGNALQWVMGEQARKLINEGGCTPHIVDELIRFGFGRRTAYTARYIGMDMMGLDLAYNLMKAKGQEPWAPIKERVERGELGMKSGKGFYDWSGDKAKQFLHDFHLELIRLLKRDMEKGDI
jgi:3-hydroxybutyryl-CoA dehydrogenase